MNRATPRLGSLALALSLMSCGGDSGPGDAAVERTTLDDGTELVRYAALPDPEAPPVAIDLRIGSLDDPDAAFGDVRGIEADATGAIYVLDFLASEIRSFGPDGAFRGVISGRGEGPGEITNANGMVLVGDTLLWVQDHGKWQMLALRTDGTEATRVPMHVLGYGYVWTGSVDDAGRIWKRWSYSDESYDPQPEEGWLEGSARVYLIGYDPTTEARDSVPLGEVTRTTYVYRPTPDSRSFAGLPYGPSPVTVLDPAGTVWRSHGSEYRIARIDLDGDTTLVIEAGVERAPVTDDDRAAYVEQRSERPVDMRAAEVVAAEMPDWRPAVTGLVVDDRGRLWVRRGRRPEDPPRYDVFEADGTHAGAVVLGFTPAEHVPIRVRHGHVYALVTDEMDVPYVVRAVSPL